MRFGERRIKNSPAKRTVSDAGDWDCVNTHFKGERLFVLRKALSLELTPAGFVLLEPEHRLDLIDRVELAIAEVIDKRVEEELQELLDVRVFFKCVFLEKQRADGKNRSIQHRHEEEREHEPEVHDAEKERNRNKDVTECFNHGAGQLKNPVLRQTNHSDATVFRVKEHAFVLE